MAHGRVQDAPAGWRPHQRLPALTTERLHALVVILAICVHLAHHAYFRLWYIEDSAICFAYARNIVAGEGIVPFPGGERIEAYSNPLWMLFLVAFQAVGIEGWVSSKAMAAAFGAATLPLTWMLAKQALPDERSVTPLLAPLLLAGSAHHAIWSASALENSLFSFLLVAGALLVLREERAPRWGFPWSAVAFFGLALTRPEGVMYAAIAGFWVLVFSLRRGGGLLPALAWAATFWLPYFAFEAWRIWYFAWPLPNTYYAKLGHEMQPLLRYYSRGWDQLREYAQVTWTGYFLWLLPLALLGRQGWRGRLAIAVTAAVGLMLLVPGPSSIRHLWFWPTLPEPRWWLVTRIVVMAVAAVGLPLLAMGGAKGWRARALLWHLGLGAVFFSVYSDGDWMRGLRWMSLFAPAQAVLIAVGVDELLHLLPRWTGQPRFGTVGWMVTAFSVALWFPPNINFSRWYFDRKDDWPELIQRRARYTSGFADRVFLEERVRNLDMDMGAHLWWTPDHKMIDMAGLVDVPMAVHNYGHNDPAHRDFIQEYVFDEQRPHFAHVHLRWAEQSNFKSYPDWDDTFFKLRGYVDGPFFHDGVYARRDLVMTPSWPHAPSPVRFAGGVTLEGVHLVNRDAARGRAMYLEAGFSTAFAREPDDAFTVTVFLSNGEGAIASWNLPMGVAHAGHLQYPVDLWKAGEVFHGKFGLPVPGSLPEGAYDLGFVVTGADGAVLPAQEIPAGLVPGGAPGEDGAAHVAVGEVRLPGLIALRPTKEIDEAANAERDEAIAQAQGGRCEQAESTWRAARLRLPLNKAWARQHTPAVNAALSRCWTEQAAAAPDRDARVELLAHAHALDHRDRAYVALSEAVAAELYALGEEARARSDWEAAYRHFSDVLRITPYNAWARRYAEEARDHRLGLHEGQPWGRSFGWW